MSTAPLNRRRFLGYSAVAGLALGNGTDARATQNPVRLGFVGLGTRGTALLRAALESPTAKVVAVCDQDPRHARRAEGIVERASGQRPQSYMELEELLARSEVDAIVVAVPCDEHAGLYVRVLEAGKHLYAEKPLGLTVEECDRVTTAAQHREDLVIHVGFQRRHNPRFLEAVERLRGGTIGEPIDCRCDWLSTNGPLEGHGGWLGRRARSGDWMLEQATHVWDLLHWIKGGPPASANGHGRRNLFTHVDHARDVTDWYVASLTWSDGFHASVRQSWIEPAAETNVGLTLRVTGTEGVLDVGSGAVVFREKGRPREQIAAGDLRETTLALQHFIQAASEGGRRSVESLGLLQQARLATQTGLLVREAVDRARTVTWAEMFGPGGVA